MNAHSQVSSSGLEKLGAENEQLREQNTELRKDIKHLKAEIVQYVAQVERDQERQKKQYKTEQTSLLNSILARSLSSACSSLSRYPPWLRKGRPGLSETELCYYRTGFREAQKIVDKTFSQALKQLRDNSW